jgi:hypothetical protein
VNKRDYNTASKVTYRGVEIEPCGRETSASPDSYWFFRLGDGRRQYPNSSTTEVSEYIAETGMPGKCGLEVYHIKLCSTCLRKLGVLW